MFSVQCFDSVGPLVG